MGGLDFSRNQKFALLALVGLIVVGVSVKLVRNANSPVYGGVTLTEAGVGVATSDSDSPYSSGGTAGKVIFQVAGCVKSPNVYTLPSGSRIIDAIKVAGGPSNGADLQSLNLAAKIEDGSRIFVPSSQSSPGPVQSAAPVTSSASQSGSAQKTSSSASGAKLHNPGDGVVNINTADSSELQRLPGIGPTTAQAILDYRAQVGRFTRAEQLDDVKGIGPKKLEKMLPFVRI